MLEDDEASYPDSGPVMDSRDSGPEESVSELEDGIGSACGDAAGKPLPRHLGHEMSCLSGGSAPCGWGPRFPLCILVPGTVIPLPRGCGCPHPGVHSFLVTISASNAKVSDLSCPGVGHVFTQSLFHLCLSSSNISISPLTLPLQLTSGLSC